MKKKLPLLMALVLTLTLLTACGGGSSVAGAWVFDDDEAVVLCLDKDGFARIYDEDYEELQYCQWSEADDVVTLELNGETVELTVDGDTLSGEGSTLTRSKDATAPYLTYNVLYDVSWYDEDDNSLIFWSDESWEVRDADGETIMEGPESSVVIDGTKVSMTDLDDEEYEAKVSAGAATLTLDGMVFEAY